MKIKITFLCCCLLCVLDSNAQQQGSFTQYLFNPAVINPAYFGKHGDLSIAAFSRWQWTGVDGAPNTQTLVAHSPIKVNNLSLGFQLMRDEIAVTSTTQAVFGGSYEIKIAHGYLSMGLQGGVQVFSNNLQEAYVTPTSQADFSERFVKTTPTIGYGFYYYARNFYLGVSSPLAIKNKIEINGENQFTQVQHYYGMTGIKIRLKNQFIIQPNILAKAVEGVPLAIDYNVSLLYKDLFWVGVSYHHLASVSLLFELKLMKNIRMGYSYDHVIEPTLSNISTSSHEIMINFQSEVITHKFD